MDGLGIKERITKTGKGTDPIARKVRAREEAGRIRHEAGRIRNEAGRIRNEAGRIRNEAGRIRNEAGRQITRKIRKKQSSDRRIGSAIGRKQSRIEEARARAREHTTGLGKIGGEHALIPTKKVLDEVLNVLIYGGIGSAMSRRLYGVGRGEEKELGGGVGIGVFGEESRGIEIEGEEGIGRLLLEKGLKEVIEGEERGEVRVELERGIGLEFEKEKEESLSLRGKSLGLIEREGYRLKEEESLRERLEERLSEEGYREEEKELTGLGKVSEKELETGEELLKDGKDFLTYKWTGEEALKKGLGEFLQGMGSFRPLEEGSSKWMESGKLLTDILIPGKWLIESGFHVYDGNYGLALVSFIGGLVPIGFIIKVGGRALKSLWATKLGEGLERLGKKLFGAGTWIRRKLFGWTKWSKRLDAQEALAEKAIAEKNKYFREKIKLEKHYKANKKVTSGLEKELKEVGKIHKRFDKKLGKEIKDLEKELKKGELDIKKLSKIEDRILKLKEKYDRKINKIVPGLGLPKRLEKVIKMDKLDVKGGITKGGKTDDPIARKVRAREEAGRIRHEAGRIRNEAGRIRNEAVGRLGEKIRKKQSSDRRIGSAIGKKQSRIEEAGARAREHTTGLGKIGGEHALIPTKKVLDEVLNVLIYGGIGSAMSRRLYGVGRGKEKELGGRVLEEGGGVGIERGIGLEFEKEKEESLSLRGKSLGLIEREGYRLKEEESLRERLEERLSEEGYREEENELEGLGGVKRLEEELKEKKEKRVLELGKEVILKTLSVVGLVLGKLKEGLEAVKGNVESALKELNWKGSPLKNLRIVLGMVTSIFVTLDAWTKAKEIDYTSGVITVNGIWNNEGAAGELNITIKEELGFNETEAEKESFVHNPTNFLIFDLLQIVLHETFRPINTPAIQLARAMREGIEEKGEIKVYAHSQGTAVTQSALTLLTEKERSQVHYKGFGGQVYISEKEYGLASSENVKNAMDPVPIVNANPIRWLNPLNWHNPRRWLNPLKWRENLRDRRREWRIGSGKWHPFKNYKKDVR